MAALFVDSSHILLLCCYISPNNKTHTRFSKYSSSEVTSSSYPSRVSFDSLSRRRQRRILLSVSGREIADVRVADNSNNVHHTRSAFVEIPVTCYQILGIPDKSEKDEIVKSMKHLKLAEIEEGYTMDTIVSRQNLLMDVRDKLLFEADYAGNVREKVPPKSSLQIPWSWLPGALSLLQEVGEEKLALDIGRTALQHPDSKPFVHDLLLSMALAECAIAKVNFEKNKISQGFEALARAQSLLKSKPSLEQMTLLSQIEESLEELAPACTLELLGMPHTQENAERRVGAIAALRELLRQGLDVESQCQIEDWSTFLNQALNKLMAAEIVELLTWDSLANTRKNKKSLESQNQRVVVDANCLYTVMMAHIALGFSSKQIEMIKKAKSILECFVASEGIALKLEEAFCLFLLGEGDEAVVIERLQQVETNLNSTSRTLLSRMDIKDASNAKKLLESWVKDALLGLFPDTRDCSPSLDNFFVGEKKVSENKNRKRAPQTSPSLNQRPLSSTFSSDWRTIEDHSSSPRLGSTVKQLTPSNLQSPLIANNLKPESYPSVQLKRNLGVHYDKVWEIWLDPNNTIRYMSFATAMFCLLFATMGVRFRGPRRVSSWALSGPNTGSLTESSHGLWGSACDKGNLIAKMVMSLWSTQKEKVKGGIEGGGVKDSSMGASLNSCKKRSMRVEEAESLVKQWQTVKAEALGPNHQLHNLVDVLDESMLLQWKGLAESAKDRCCFWRFVLLQLTILQADILSDETGKEMAEIEALVEEAAELVDSSHKKNPNYYSTYTIRYLLKKQEDGSWKFCEGDVEIQS
ncbi:unnamed protein product [Lactuca virosa]|uniref:ARC6 IMS domain-containing protein n=1 Tax=Lactuca virosa TaxID=75947 RepID=A0AAU9P8B9_9ASTR|nr:unnamed protein product [Lactuca virosa]